MVNKIIDGICLKLSETFGEGYEIYTENIKQGFKEPCFFIDCITSSKNRIRGNLYGSESLFNISYFPTDDGGNRECYEVLNKLYDCLEFISVEDRLIRGIGIKSEVVDGVLQVQINYNMHLLAHEDKTNMSELTQKGGLNG